MKTPSTRGLRFVHLYLENWRNFAHVDVELAPRVFLVGPNASGKSNLLDVLRFLHDIVTIGGGFQEAIRLRRGVSSLRCLASRRYPDVVVRVSIGRESGVAAWQYELRFTQDNLRRPIIKKEKVTAGGAVILDRPDKEDRGDSARLTQTYLEQVNVNRRFRDVVELFGSVRYLHIVPQLVR